MAKAAKAKPQTRKTYAAGYKQCKGCELFILGTRTAVCPKCDTAFVTKPKADKPKRVTTYKPLADEPKPVSLKDAINFIHQAGSLEAAQEQLQRVADAKRTVEQLEHLGIN